MLLNQRDVVKNGHYRMLRGKQRKPFTVKSISGDTVSLVFDDEPNKVSDRKLHEIVNIGLKRVV